METSLNQISEVNVSISSGDTVLSGIYETPTSTRAHGLRMGAVILLHGFGGYKEQAHLSQLAHELNQAGFATLRFDATGIGESDGEHPERFRLESYRRDIDVCLEEVATFEGVDPKSIGLWGHSLGGLLGVVAAAEDPRVGAVCAVSPPHIAGQGVNAETALQLWQERGCLVKSNPHHGMVRFPFSCMNGAADWNGIEAAGRLKIPLLVIAGARDQGACQVFCVSSGNWLVGQTVREGNAKRVECS